jgi:diguanylate cyclase (GGDEF)-like protein
MPRNFKEFEQSHGVELLRTGLLQRVSLILLLLLVPVGAVNAHDGYYSLAAFILASVVIVAVNLPSIRKERPPPLPPFLLFLSLTATTVISFRDRGVYGVFFIAPVVAIMWVIFPERVARILVIAYSVTATASSFLILDTDLAWRNAAATLAVSTFIGFFVAAINTLQERLVELAGTDALTGAKNRRDLEKGLRVAVDRKRRHDIPSSMLVLDIDHFKQINDRFGHAAGDKVLTQFVSFVRDHSRHTDDLFRVGGEEFVLVLPDTPLSGASLLAEKLLSTLRETSIADHRITMSVGAAEIREDEVADHWTERADEALYLAKNSGRDRLVLG